MKKKNCIATIEDLKNLYNELIKEYTVISPIINEDSNVIVFEKNNDFSKIPFHYSSIENTASYFLDKNHKKYFSYVRPVNSPKNFLRPSEELLFKVVKRNGEIFFENVTEIKKIAFFDVRKCDLKAISILDDVFIHKNHFPDEYYKIKRENATFISVNCINVSDNCFCSSMEVDFKEDYIADIVITELDDEFLLEINSEKGLKLINLLDLKEASEEDLLQKEKVLKDSYKKIKRKLDTKDLKEILYSKLDHPYWFEVGNRCLSCGNCTQVCPTCFCFDIVEKNTIDGFTSQRIRVSDSCFNPSFATVHKFNLRDNVSFRYRHWLMHKMAYWQDQFGYMGCIGCGRCITWCPTKIDIQIETNKIRDIE